MGFSRRLLNMGIEVLQKKKKRRDVTRRKVQSIAEITSYNFERSKLQAAGKLPAIVLRTTTTLSRSMILTIDCSRQKVHS